MARVSESRDGGGMKTIVRVLGISAAAVAGYFVLYLAGGGAEATDANIGAGLIIFAVLAVGSFLWAFADGWRDPAEFGALTLRWVLVCALLPIVTTVVLVVTGGVVPAWGVLEALGLWFFEFAMAFAPAIAALGLGYAVRASTRPSPGSAGGPPPGLGGVDDLGQPGQTGQPGRPGQPGQPGQTRSS